jgi:hypothetical protein
MENLHSAVDLMRRREKEYIEEVEGYRLARRAAGGDERRRSRDFSVSLVLERIQCHMDSLRRRLLRWARAAKLTGSTASPGPVMSREPC